MPRHWQHRENKLDKRRNGMRVSNKGIFTMKDANAKRDQKKMDRIRKEKRGE